jgi:hypothetical protein
MVKHVDIRVRAFEGEADPRVEGAVVAGQQGRRRREYPQRRDVAGHFTLDGLDDRTCRAGQQRLDKLRLGLVVAR